MENFDKKLKEKINRYNSTVDPELIWEGIQRKRKVDKKKRRFPFLLLAACLILLIGIPVIFNLETIFNRKGSEITGSDQKLNEKINPDTRKEIASNVSENKSVFSENTINTLKNNDESQTSLIFNNKNKKNNSGFVLTQVSKNSKSDQINNSDIISNSENNVNNNEDENKSYYALNTSLTKLIIPNFNVKIRTEPTDLKPKIMIAEIKKKVTKNPIYLSLEAAPQYVFRQISSLDETSDVYAENVINHEKLLESFALKLILRKPVYKNIYLGSGIAYSQTDRKLDFTYNSTETYEDNNVLTRMVVNRPGDTIRYHSAKMVTANYEINEKIYNYNRKLKIPLIIGYYGKIGKMDFDINAGIDLKIWDFSKGRMITPEGKTIDINDPTNNLLKDNILQNLSISMSIRKKLTEKLYFAFGPELKYGFNTYSRMSGLHHSENIIWIKLGLTYKI